jgi:hypothetical protein
MRGKPYLFCQIQRRPVIEKTNPSRSNSARPAIGLKNNRRRLSNSHMVYVRPSILGTDDELDLIRSGRKINVQ